MAENVANIFDMRAGRKKLNAGRARSIDGITSALFELMRDKPFAEVSVTDICTKACVSRKTFYRNFGSKLAVVVRLVDQVFFEFTQKFDYTVSGARKIYMYWYEYMLGTREFAAMFLDADLYALMVEKLRDVVQYELAETLFMSRAFDPMLTDYYFDFAANGIASIIREWVKKDCKTPAKTMATMTARLLSGVLA